MTLAHPKLARAFLGGGYSAFTARERTVVFGMKTGGGCLYSYRNRREPHRIPRALPCLKEGGAFVVGKEIRTSASLRVKSGKKKKTGASLFISQKEERGKSREEGEAELKPSREKGKRG